MAQREESGYEDEGADYLILSFVHLTAEAASSRLAALCRSNSFLCCGVSSGTAIYCITKEQILKEAFPCYNVNEHSVVSKVS
jgi:hypothetical protein